MDSHRLGAMFYPALIQTKHHFYEGMFCENHIFMREWGELLY